MGVSAQQDFEANLKQGQGTEGDLSRFFIRRGCGVLPVYETEGTENKGPRFFTAETDLVAPDMLVFKGTKITWVECKHKTVFSWHFRTERWVTGIDLHHWEDYQKVADRTERPFWLFFLHVETEANPSGELCPTGLFGNDMASLKKDFNHTHPNWGRHGMIYWAADKLRKIAELDEVAGTNPEPS